jgi:hypothetical protein
LRNFQYRPDAVIDMIVIVDRPGKEAIIEPCEKIDTDTVVFIGHQGILEAITSDRGSQFVNALWERFCELLRSGDSPLPTIQKQMIKQNK